MEYETVVGMEVHVELQTASKLFCSCAADHFQIPANEHVCPVCTGQPGALPVINEEAVRLTVMTGMALGCDIRPHSVFARKNYVYPDLPKGYQISQYEEPLCVDGYLDIDFGGEGGVKRVGIVRVHLEEDAGKLVHDGEASLVDYNRASVPLMEIVSDSSLRSADEAFAYLQKIRQLVRYLGASSGDMEKGAMRCEANVSVRPAGASEYGTKVEVKNLNSFRSVRNAIHYEVERQIEALAAGESIRQVTMGWDEDAGATREQRSKEFSDDYRYFPEPDLLDIQLSPEWLDGARKRLPELPDAKAARFVEQFGLETADAELLVDDQGIAAYYEETLGAGADPKLANNWITGEVFRRLNEAAVAIDEIVVRPAHLAELIGLVQDSTVNQTAAKEVFSLMWESGGSAADIVDERGLRQISDTSQLESAVTQVIADNGDAVDKVRDGNLKPIGFLMGQVMKATAGKANPKLVQELLRAQIGA